MLSYDFNYFYIFFYLLFSIFLTLILFFISWLLAPKSNIKEKNSAYECGFIPFNDTRSLFEVNFFLIGILFLVFDLELTFLFPWATSLVLIGLKGFYSMLIFILVLFLGFFFEWCLGGFDFKSIRPLKNV
jgi:NADH:ubiquinone oxidoreductase subunit 3 (subunit A)